MQSTIDQLLETAESEMNTTPDSAIQNAKLALEISESEHNKSGIALSCRMLTHLNYLKGFHSEAIEYGEKALQYSRLGFDKQSESQLYSWLGIIYRAVGKVDKALEYQLEALNVSRELGSKNSELLALGNLGHIYFDISHYDIALDYYLQALALAEVDKDKTILHRQLNNLGALYSTIKDNHKALEYFFQSLAIRKDLNDTNAIASSLCNIGEEYRAIGEYEKAFDYLEQSLAIAKSSGNSSQTALALGNIGITYESIGDFIHSFEYHQKALEVIEPLRDKQNYTNMLSHVGKLYLRQKKYENARESLFQALVISEDYRGRELQAEIHKILSDVYEEEGDTTNAFFHFKQFNSISNEVNQQSQQKAIALLEMRYGNQKAEKEKEELRRKLLQSEHKTLRAQINPHFMFNALNSIQHFLTQSDTEQANRYLSKFARLMRLVMENSKHTTIALSDEIETITHYLELEKLRFSGKFSYEIVISPEVTIDTILIPPMLLQPFIENSIWHGILPRKSGGKIVVTISCSNEDFIDCTIEDDGIGRKASSEQKPFEQSKHKSSGMSLIAERLAILSEISGKEFSVEIIDLLPTIDLHTGTRVILHLPQNLAL